MKDARQKAQQIVDEWMIEHTLGPVVTNSEQDDLTNAIEQALQEAAKVEWLDIRPVFGYEKFYLISKDCRIFSLVSNKELKATKTPQGYYRFCLYNRDTKEAKGVPAHRILLMSFTRMNDIDKHVAHKNGIRTDNRLENLYWATPQENGRDKILHGTNKAGESNSSSVLTADDVRYIVANYKRDSYGKSNLKELAKKFGVSKPTITQILNGRVWNEVTGIAFKRGNRRLWLKRMSKEG